MMKKKLLALLLVVALVCSLGSYSFAAVTGGFNVIPGDLTLRVGDEKLLETDCFDPLTWTSSNTNVVTVDSTGYVKAVGLGIATVTASSQLNSNLTARSIIHVGYKGIDVSSHQNSINWATVANSKNADFAIIRTGYGSEAWDVQKDKYFEANYSGALQNGIKVGVYHYSYATTVAAAEKEAEFCLNILNGRKLDYPVFYDIEEQSQRKLAPEVMADVVEAFCNKIEAAGYRVGIYSSPNWLNSCLSSPRLAKYDVWLAHWGTNLSSYTKPYKMWQYGYITVPGISGQTDANYSYFDYSSTGNEGGGYVPPVDNSGNGSSDGGNTGNTPVTMASDTNGTYTFGSNGTYTYKITTNGTTPPVAVSSDTNVCTVEYSKATSGGYLYKIINKGVGQAVITTTDNYGNLHSLGIQGKEVNSVPANTLKSDTNGTYTFNQYPAYTYKIITSNKTAPTAVSSDTSVCTVERTQTVSDGYLFKITNKGAGTATVTTTDNAGNSHTLAVVGKAGSGSSTGGTLKSDTTGSYNFGSNSSYYYKITTSNKTAPTASSSNTAVATVALSKTVSDGYLFQVTNKGAGQAVITTKDNAGASTSFTVNGKGSGSSGGAVSGSVKSDTPAAINMEYGKSYQFKFTMPSGTKSATFTTGNSSIIQGVKVVQQGSDYYFTIKASATGQAGVYISLNGNTPERQCIVTVARG